jgi:hypothetical protein
MEKKHTIEYLASEIWCFICDVVGFCEHIIEKVGLQI